MLLLSLIPQIWLVSLYSKIKSLEEFPSLHHWVPQVFIFNSLLSRYRQLSVKMKICSHTFLSKSQNFLTLIFLWGVFPVCTESPCGLGRRRSTLCLDNVLIHYWVRREVTCLLCHVSDYRYSMISNKPSATCSLNLSYQLQEVLRPLRLSSIAAVNFIM